MSRFTAIIASLMVLAAVTATSPAGAVASADRPAGQVSLRTGPVCC